MELIRTHKGTWYWLVDCRGVGFAESIEYESEKAAVIAAITGKIVWKSQYFEFNNN